MIEERSIMYDWRIEVLHRLTDRWLVFEYYKTEAEARAAMEYWSKECYGEEEFRIKVKKTA